MSELKLIENIRTLEDGFISIDFSLSEGLNTFRDAIVVSDAEMAMIDLEKIKQERYAEWLLAVTPPPPMSENQDG